MDTVQLVPPVGGNRTRFGRLVVCVLLAILMLGIALPAQAGLGDLLDDLLDPVDDLPVLDEVLDPVLDTVDPLLDVAAPLVDPVVGGIVDPLLDQVVTPVVTEVVQPILEEVIPPVVGDPPPPPPDELLPPPLQDLISPIESVLDPGVSTTFDPGTGSQPSLTSQFESSPANVDTGDSLVLALSLQTQLAIDGQEAAASSQVAETRIGTTSLGWLDGLTDWLRGAADGLLSLLAIPIRLLELLLRALLTAGSGLVAPASLLLIFTAHAIRDRRSRLTTSPDLTLRSATTG